MLYGLEAYVDEKVRPLSRHLILRNLIKELLRKPLCESGNNSG